MWRALHAAIFGPSTDNAAPTGLAEYGVTDVTDAARPAATTPSVRPPGRHPPVLAGFEEFQAAVANAVITPRGFMDDETPAPPAVSAAAPPAHDAADGLDRPPAPWRVHDGVGPHGFVAVVGESFYQEALQGLSQLFETIERTERTFTATLVPEPTNAQDTHAVAVTTHDGTKIGYLSADMAETYQKRLLRLPALVRCPAQLHGGDDGKDVGVVLDFKGVYPRLRLRG